MKTIERSQALMNEALRVIPGGVNSPVRAFKSVGLPPRFIKSGAGCRITDVDDNEFIDYVGSWGPLILGHANPEVLEAIQQTLQNGTTFGAPTSLEVEMALTITELVPSIEMVRLVSSGTEAAMSAIRLARGFTGRDKIIKFSGCYHGHSDGLLAKAGSGAATFALPDSLGVPSNVIEQTIVLPYNDLEAVEKEVTDHPNRLAAIIVEPVAGNMGVVPPEAGFLEGLRNVCTNDGALLIFDEVITGFRIALGGAQQRYNVMPDLTCLGKIIGGGLPAAAFGGNAQIMEMLAPIGGVYQAGTLSGNPLAVAAGKKVLDILKRDNPYPELERKGKKLADGVAEILTAKKIPFQLNRVGSMMSLFFNSEPVLNYADALSSDKALFNSFFGKMLDNGIYLAPSAYEAWFVGVAHSDTDIDFTLKAVEQSV